MQINTYRSDGYEVIAIPAYMIKVQNDLRIKVAQVLCRKYERTKDEKKRQTITKHLMRLTTPTKEAATA